MLSYIPLKSIKIFWLKMLNTVPDIDSCHWLALKSSCAVTNDRLMLSLVFKVPSLPPSSNAATLRLSAAQKKHAWFPLHLGWKCCVSLPDRSRTSTSRGSPRTWQPRRGCCSGPSRSQTATWAYGATTSPPPGGTGGYSMPSFIDTGTKTPHKAVGDFHGPRVY